MSSPLSIGNNFQTNQSGFGKVCIEVKESVGYSVRAAFSLMVLKDSSLTVVWNLCPFIFYASFFFMIQNKHK